METEKDYEEFLELLNKHDVPSHKKQVLINSTNIILAIRLIVSYNDTMGLSKKHKKILHKIYEDPVRSDVAWSDIESLLKYLGAELSEGRGSRMRIYLNGIRAVFHRPHPHRETDKGALRSMRRFLSEAGIQQGE